MYLCIYLYVGIRYTLTKSTVYKYISCLVQQYEEPGLAM